MKPVVILLHGIGDLARAREWQDAVTSVLEPHFECIPISYPHFKDLGALKVLQRGKLRHEALKHVVREYDEKCSGVWRPHLVAHSFGTCLAVDWFRLAGYSWGRVVFAGSPLPGGFDWRELLREEPVFESLANETGGQDSVVKAAGIAGVVFDHLGDAGVNGFSCCPPVHTGDLTECAECSAADSATSCVIHNISFPHYTHSDWFVGIGHSANLWLPFLWGIDPRGYRSFVDLALDAVRLEYEENWPEARRIETVLEESRWDWCRGDRLLDRAEKVVKAIAAERHVLLDAQQIRNAAESAVHGLPHILADALKQRRLLSDCPFPERIRRLQPSVALAAAATAALMEITGKST